MQESELLARIKNIINSNYKFNEKEKETIDDILKHDLNYDRMLVILKFIVDLKLDKSSVLAFLCYQLYKSYPEDGENICLKLNDEQQKIVNDFKTIKDLNQLTLSEEIEDIRRMFIVMSNDMRVVIIKLAGIYYDISKMELPLDENNWRFVRQVRDIHVPLAERLGLDDLKQNLYDNVIRLEHPKEYNQLKEIIESKREENEKQLKITKEKIQNILDDLKIKGEIISRIKHISSIFNKLYNKRVSLDQIYDILAMRVIVDTVEECYSVLGRIHGIYKPMIGRVKDYIANPKPNGYKSLHTTIIVENQHPLEVQIRTKEMHRESEFGGVCAHWLYKEKKDKKTDFDDRLTWFRQTIENAKNMSNEDFIDTLKSDLYDGVIIVQTPKGRVIEFPEGATAIDFAYAIHSGVGNSCVGAKINGKLKPITTVLRNGDIVEILTSSHSKGPSRDWLKFVKTNGARSKIKSFFKTELKSENIRQGKTMFNQSVQDKGYSLTQLLTDKYIIEILKRYNMEDMDELYASIGTGSMTSSQVASRFINLYNNDNSSLPKVENVVHLKRNKEGVLIDGDSGMLVRFAGCCNPIEGDDIIGYISRGKGVAIHRSNCPNLKYLEAERLIGAQWNIKQDATFMTTIKVLADKTDNNIGKLTNSLTSLKINIRGFDAKDTGDYFICSLRIEVKNKAELDSAINAIRNIKQVTNVYRGEV